MGLTPEKFNEITSEENLCIQIDPKDIKKALKIKEVSKKILKELKSNKDYFVHKENKTSFMYLPQYIKLIALNNIPCTRKFFNSLPISLMELFFDFQPLSVALRTKSRFSRDYHEAKYLSAARDLIESSPKKLTPQEIYKNKMMQNVMDTFEDHNRKRKQYETRTIMNWISKEYPQSKGRPKKALKIKTQ